MQRSYDEENERKQPPRTCILIKRRDCRTAPQCHFTRSQAQRTGDRKTWKAMKQQHHKAQGASRRAHTKSKRRTWTKLCNMVNEDTAGRTYRTVKAKLMCRKRVPPSCLEVLARTVTSLFPDQLEAVLPSTNTLTYLLSRKRK